MASTKPYPPGGLRAKLSTRLSAFAYGASAFGVCVALGLSVILVDKTSETASRNEDLLCDLGRLVRVSREADPVRHESESYKEWVDRRRVIHRFLRAYNNLDCEGEGFTAPRPGEKERKDVPGGAGAARREGGDANGGGLPPINPPG